MVLALEINGAPFSAEGLKSTKLVRDLRVRSTHIQYSFRDHFAPTLETTPPVKPQPKRLLCGSQGKISVIRTCRYGRAYNSPTTRGYMWFSLYLFVTILSAECCCRHGPSNCTPLPRRINRRSHQRDTPATPTKRCARTVNFFGT